MADVDATPRLKKHNGCAGAKRGAYRLKAPANQGLLQNRACRVQIPAGMFQGGDHMAPTLNFYPVAFGRLFHLHRKECPKWIRNKKSFPSGQGRQERTASSAHAGAAQPETVRSCLIASASCFLDICLQPCMVGFQQIPGHQNSVRSCFRHQSCHVFWCRWHRSGQHGRQVILNDRVHFVFADGFPEFIKGWDVHSGHTFLL